MTNTETRAVPPSLVFHPPTCPMCGNETSIQDDCFVCEACEAAWHKNGEFALWTDFENQCPATVQPWKNLTSWTPETEQHRYEEFRCMLGDGHGRRGFRLHAHPGVNGKVWARGWR